MPLTSTASHPLLQRSKPGPEAIVEEFDPLRASRAVSQAFSSTAETVAPASTQSPEALWVALRTFAVENYSSKGAFSITSTAEPEEAKVVSSTFSRMELLDTIHSTQQKEVSYLSNQEFISHIQSLGKEMEAAWGQNDRVKTLKIAIQAVKMLKDIMNPEFYPSVFMTIIELLDTFSSLVYTRLKEMAFEGRETTDSFPSASVAQKAKDTALNWFLKTSCIRELIPRLYVEMSLLRCYRFLWDDKYDETLKRLSEQLRGIGNPVTVSTT